MPTELPLARHLEGLRAAMVAFVRYADRAGLRAPVPTCPEWTVRDLVAHQGMVHRWAAALLRGERDVDPDAIEAAGAAEPDPLEWLRDGVIDLAETLTGAPADARAPVFLNDAPAPREFWARRQCHETTVHAVDAMSAALGRFPDPGETWIDTDLAVDGIDELLGGFLTRPRSRLRCDDEALLVVAPDDAPDFWLVELGPRPATTTRRTGPATRRRLGPRGQRRRPLSLALEPDVAAGARRPRGRHLGVSGDESAPHARSARARLTAHVQR